MADEELILRVEADTAGAVESVIELTKAIEETTQANKDLTKTQKALGERTEKNSAEWDENARQIAINKNELQQMNQQRKASIQVSESETDSLNQLRASLVQLKQQRNENLQVGTEAFDQASERILVLNEQIKAAEEAGGDFQRSVGNYATAVDGLTDSVGDLIPGLGSTIKGFEGMTKSALKFIATPIGAVIALIAGALKAITLSFTRTAEGQEELAVMTARLSSLFETFLDIVSAVGKYLFSIFVPVIKAVVDSFMAAFKAVQALGRILKGDFTGAAESARESLDRINSSFDNLKDAGRNLRDNFQELAESIRESVDAAGAKSEIAQQLARDEFRLTEAIIENTVAEAQRNKQIAESVLLSRDQTKSIEERGAALEVATALELENLAAKEAILAETLRIAQVRDSLHDSTIEDLQAVATAEANLLNFQTQSFNKQRQLINRSNALETEQEALRKKNETDRLQRVAQRDKDREDAVKADAKVLKLEEDKLQKEADLSNQILMIRKQREIDTALITEDRIRRQIELENLRFEHLLKSTEEFSQEAQILLLKHEDTLTAIHKEGSDERAKIELEAHKQTDKLRQENEARDRQSKDNFISLTAQTFSKASKLATDNAELSKALAVAAATINTLQAITKTLAMGGAFAIPSAIAVGALGFATVAEILRTDVSGTTSTSSGSSSASSTAVDTGSADDQISERDALVGALESLNATVSVSEINRAQSKVEVSESNSQLA